MCLKTELERITWNLMFVCICPAGEVEQRVARARRPSEHIHANGIEWGTGELLLFCCCCINDTLAGMTQSINPFTPLSDRIALKSFSAVAAVANGIERRALAKNNSDFGSFTAALHILIAVANEHVYYMHRIEVN